MITKTLIEEIELPEETETEKDYTSLYGPIKEYNSRLIEAINTFEDELPQLQKIRARLASDATNLAAVRDKLDYLITNLANWNSSKTNLNTFFGEFSKKIEEEEKASSKPAETKAA